MTDTGHQLCDFTTLRVGGPARELKIAKSPEELKALVREADESGMPLLVVGSGSNMLVSDEGFDGLVVVTVDELGPMVVDRTQSHTRVIAKCGCVWDDLVELCIRENLAGLEALSGIPGQIGSAVMQNLGAYGQEMSSCLVSATLYDRKERRTVVCRKNELGLGYRTSILRRSVDNREDEGRWAYSPRWIVLEAMFELENSEVGTIGHPQLAAALHCETGTTMPLGSIRDAVLKVREQKGMVVDPDPLGSSPLYDRWSSGSFFTNPIVSVEKANLILPEGAPRYSTGDDALVKTSAAWLIEHAGFGKGYGVHGADSAATLSGLHTLALTNRGKATAKDIVELCMTVRKGVWERFGIMLTPETILVGIEL